VSDNIFQFPKREKLDANAVLEGAKDNLSDCIILGTTKNGEAYYAIHAESPQQVIYLLRALEHIVLELEINGE
jgi:hypothetical protein